MRNHLLTGLDRDLCLISPGQLFIGSKMLARCCPVLYFTRTGFHCMSYTASSWMARGVAPCQWILCWLIVTGVLSVSATHDVSDHGAGPGEDAASELRLTEQWNDAEATYGGCR